MVQSREELFCVAAIAFVEGRSNIFHDHDSNFIGTMSLF
jgi:hypothetical protein